MRDASSAVMETVTVTAECPYQGKTVHILWYPVEMKDSRHGNGQYRALPYDVFLDMEEPPIPHRLEIFGDGDVERFKEGVRQQFANGTDLCLRPRGHYVQ